MRRSKRTYVALLLAAAALVACSSDRASSGGEQPEPDGGVPAPAPVTAEAACEHQFRVRVERCTNGNIAPATVASARTRYVADCVAALGLPGSTRTADEVEACASALEPEECGVIAELLPACTPKAGTLATNTACNVGAQCASGNCELRAEGKGCGVCKDPAAEGEGCSAENPACAAGTFCVGEPNASRMTCKRVSYVAAGASCNGFDAQCRPGFICAAIDGAAPVCIQALDVGKECRDDAHCAKGTYCSQRLAQCTKRGAAGEACDSTQPCGDGLGCDRESQTCAALTFAEPGESCGGSVACREGICGQGTGAPRCAPIVEDGAGCLAAAHMTCRAPAACVGGGCVMPTTASCQ